MQTRTVEIHNGHCVNTLEFIWYRCELALTLTRDRSTAQLSGGLSVMFLRLQQNNISGGCLKLNDPRWDAGSLYSSSDDS